MSFKDMTKLTVAETNDLELKCIESETDVSQC